MLGVVNSNWRNEGSATVKENFIRLTPDLPNKKGALTEWKAIQFEEFSAILKFRISGKGKNLFGDGMALWLRDMTSIPRKSKSGKEIHGHPAEFYGFGILFDTFRNNEKGEVHKDISFVQSAGKPIELLNKRQGCSAKYRLYEGKDSFSISQYSAVKIHLKKNRLTVQFDKQGSGKFITCFEANLGSSKVYQSVRLYISFSIL